MEEKIFDNGIISNGEEVTEKIIVEDVSQVKEKPLFDAVKRCLDFFFALFALLLLWLPMLVIGVVVRTESPGKAIYKQERLGLKGRRFTIYKFRSMVEDAELEGARWAQEDDPRTTKVGAFLRKTRLDELPQLFNILKGDMSFVGPRPEREIFYNEFDKYIVGFRQRLMIKPGLTGLAQIEGGYDLLPEEKIVYDIEYIKKRSILFDIRIVFSTVKIVFNHDGAR